MAVVDIHTSYSFPSFMEIALSVTFGKSLAFMVEQEWGLPQRAEARAGMQSTEHGGCGPTREKFSLWRGSGPALWQRHKDLASLGLDRL